MASKTLKLNKVEFNADISNQYNPNAELSEDDGIIRNVQANLNKLTENSANKIGNELVTILKSIADNDSLMTKVSNVIFYKAISDIKFIHIHADLIVKYNKGSLSTLVHLLKQHVISKINSSPYNYEKMDAKMQKNQ